VSGDSRLAFFLHGASLRALACPGRGSGFVGAFRTVRSAAASAWRRRRFVRSLSRRRFFLPPLAQGRDRFESHGHGALRVRKSARRSSSAYRRPPGRGPAAERIRTRRVLDRRNYMSLLIGTFTIGFVLSLLALGVFISFRIFAFPDITTDGSITLGAAVA